MKILDSRNIYIIINQLSTMTRLIDWATPISKNLENVVIIASEDNSVIS